MSRLFGTPLALAVCLAFPGRAQGIGPELVTSLSGQEDKDKDADRTPDKKKTYPYVLQSLNADRSKTQHYAGGNPANAPLDPALAEDLKLEEEIKTIKRNEKGPARLAQDLFDLRQHSPFQTEGGVPDDYVLGTGDVLQFHAFGATPMEAQLRVDGRGEVVIPHLGKVKVSGRTLGQAKGRVQELIGRNFGRTQAELQVSKLREVRVFVLGDVYKPGAYLVPSMNSLVNVLSLAGGPTTMGSYRDIRLLRGGDLLESLDLYPLRMEGRGNFNRALQNGDVIFVPIKNRNILMTGAFRRLGPSWIESDEKVPDNDRKLSLPTTKDPAPVLVELKDEETAWDAVRFLGGLNPDAYAAQITIERTDGQGFRNILSLSAEEATLRATKLMANDVVRALLRTDTAKGFIQVAGYARIPGRFAFKEGLTLGRFLKDQGQLLPDTYLGRVEVLRTRQNGNMEMISRDLGKVLSGEQELGLEPLDKISLFALDDLRDRPTVTITGPVAHVGTFDWYSGMRASDLLFKAGLPKPGTNLEYGELAHSGALGKETVLPLDLKKLLSTETYSSAALDNDAINPPVLPYDSLTLYERPNFKVQQLVKISGEVHRPGTFSLTEPHYTLSKLLQRAGGLTEDAMAAGAIFLRKTVQTKEVAKSNAASAIRTTDPTGRGVMEILERLSETKRQPITGQLLHTPILNGLAQGGISRVVFSMEKMLKGDKSMDLELQDGDEIIIPKITQTAYAIGEIASPFFAYKVPQGTRVSELLKLAGGLTRNADSSNIRLLKADGRILESGVSGQVVEPGDAVLVPQRILRDTTWQENLNALTPVALILNAILRK